MPKEVWNRKGSSQVERGLIEILNLHNNGRQTARAFHNLSAIYQRATTKGELFPS